MRSHPPETVGETEPVSLPVKPARRAGAVLLIASIAAGLSAAALFFFGGGYLLQQQREASVWVSHTREVIAAVANIEANLSTVTSEGRGFLLDKSVGSKARYDDATLATDRDLTNLRLLTADNSVQQQTLDRLNPLVALRLEKLRDVIRLVTAGDTDGVARKTEIGEGRALMDSVLTLTGRMAAEEQRLLILRNAAVSRTEQLAMAGLVGYGVLVTASTAIAIALLMGRKRERKRLTILSHINADLENHVQARTAALFASEERFQLLAERANGMVSIIGPDGEPCYVSPAAAALFGVRPEALLGHGVLERTLPEDRPALEISLRRLLAGTVEEEEVGFRALHPDGSTIWIEAAARRVRNAMTGAHDGYVIVWRDVTRRRHAEALLNESGARFRLLAEHTTDAIVCLDLEFQLTYLSPAYVAIFGYDTESLVGGVWGLHIHPDESEDVQNRLSDLAAGLHDHARGTYRNQHKDGHWIWVEANCDLVRDHDTGLPASIICVLRDVSERVGQTDELHRANLELGRLTRHITKARDTALQASRTKSRFLATMSHELRTPLNGIIGYSELLRLEAGLTGAQSAILEKLQDAGHHLLEMIAGVLDLSEVEADRVVMNVVRTNLIPLAAACLDLVRMTAEAKGLTVTLTVAPGTPRELTIDPARLRQVLLNLLGNAVKFTTTGSVALHLRPADEANFVRIEVLDTGRGIAAEQRHLLFREFERLGSDMADVLTEGTGLGLTISMRLVTLMGGRIGYADNPSGGSIFWFELPQWVQAAASAIPGPTVQPLVTGPLRILLVDDVLMNRDIAGSFLRSGGHEVVLAEGGEEAVAAAGSADYDLVLMDVRMPEVDGLEATRRIRAIMGRRGRVPIMGLTAQAFVEQVTECRLAGMNAHLAKPYTRETLLTAVAAAFAAGQERDAKQEAADAAAPLVCDAVEFATECASAQADGATHAAAESEISMLDLATFENTAALLSPAAVTSYLQTIAQQTEGLLSRLRAEDGLTNGGDELPEAAHRLAGSAGLFGFGRLATVAREFEHAARTNSSEMPVFVANLAAALEGSLQEIRRRLPLLSLV